MLHDSFGDPTAVLTDPHFVGVENHFQGRPPVGRVYSQTKWYLFKHRKVARTAKLISAVLRAKHQTRGGRCKEEPPLSNGGRHASKRARWAPNSSCLIMEWPIAPYCSKILHLHDRGTEAETIATWRGVL